MRSFSLSDHTLVDRGVGYAMTRNSRTDKRRVTVEDSAEVYREESKNV